MERDVDCLGVGVDAGEAIDFQYVSTAPPISRVTPLKGLTTLISNVTYDKYSALIQINECSEITSPITVKC